MTLAFVSTASLGTLVTEAPLVDFFSVCVWAGWCDWLWCFWEWWWVPEGALRPRTTVVVGECSVRGGCVSDCSGLAAARAQTSHSPLMQQQQARRRITRVLVEMAIMNVVSFRAQRGDRVQGEKEVL